MFQRTILSIFLPLSLMACSTTAPINQPIAQAKYNSQLEVLPHLKEGLKNGKDPETLLVLAFSGGGTRAAALSYGVLEELHRTIVHSNGHPHPLSDDISAISGVSGGGFTALSYALYGDKLFDIYVKSFLKRDVQGTIVKRVLNPLNWPKLASSRYGRAELAAEYYDEILFKNATFADLLKNKAHTFASVSASELATGIRFNFTQDSFNLICSDLSSMKLSRAAAATSSVPGVFSPVVLHNYAGSCNYKPPEWAQEMAKESPSEQFVSRKSLHLRDMQTLQDRKNHPFLHFVDGGITDNLGVRSILSGLDQYSDYKSKANADDSTKKIKRVVVIVVNAMTVHPNDIDKTESSPGIIAQLTHSSSVPMDRYSHESLTSLSSMVERWKEERELKVAQLRLAGIPKEKAEAAVPETKLFAIDISFENVENEKLRLHLLDLPTSFRLSDEDVDQLRTTGASLLRNSPVFQSLLKEIN